MGAASLTHCSWSTAVSSSGGASPPGVYSRVSPLGLLRQPFSTLEFDSPTTGSTGRAVATGVGGRGSVAVVGPTVDSTKVSGVGLGVSVAGGSSGLGGGSLTITGSGLGTGAAEPRGSGDAGFSQPPENATANAANTSARMEFQRMQVVKHLRIDCGKDALSIGPHPFCQPARAQCAPPLSSLPGRDNLSDS